MMDARLLKRLITLSAVLLAVASVLSLAFGFPAFAGGLLVGLVLGTVPAVSWAWIAGRGFASKRNRTVAALLVGGKLAFYGGLLYLVVTRPVVDPIAIFAGMTTVVAVLTLGPLLAGGPARGAA